VGVCQSNAKGYCLGCLRSRSERLNWKDLAPCEKMRVIELCDARRAKLKAMAEAKKRGESLERFKAKPKETAPESKADEVDPQSSLGDF
jgi:predicted Fe-S protein YdhL (DUF1289 family)